MNPVNKTIFDTLTIENYKSIKKIEIPLTHLNVFIGANGCGKSNILEAVALVAAERDWRVKISDLQQLGVRITKASLMKNSFMGEKTEGDPILGEKIVDPIYVDLKREDDHHTVVLTPESDDFFGDLLDEQINDFFHEFEHYFYELEEGQREIVTVNKSIYMIEKQKAQNLVFFVKKIESPIDESKKEFFDEKEYVIYTLNTNALRGLSNESKLQPLGIYGEGLDVLLSTFKDEEWNLLQQYTYLIDWLDSIHIDREDKLKHNGHKLGRSNSLLYFKDKYMRENNNLFSAENSNEGVLHVLFYLALFISKKTPSFFAIDNIESSLNPRVCRELIKALAQLAVQTNKQVLITTHNPAILDGLNLHDPNQALFVVKRSDEGHTKVKKIAVKPKVDGEQLKLSEMWMRGHLGGLPNNF